jgi:hypothetical protein
MRCDGGRLTAASRLPSSRPLVEHMRTLCLFLLLVLASSGSLAQIQFRSGGVELKQRALRPGDVRMFLDRKDFKNARDIALQCLRDTGDGWCEFYAGMLTYGAPGLEPNEPEGLKLIRSAAEKEVSSAQVFIGNLHFNGTGVPRNPAEAVRWWTRAANNCNAWAQNALARTYFDGEHVRQDYVEAYYWVSLAAYYRFPNAATGQEVIGRELSDEQRKGATERWQRFSRDSGCGSTAARPVVHEN